MKTTPQPIASAQSDNHEQSNPQTIYIALNDQQLTTDISSYIANFCYNSHSFNNLDTLAQALQVNPPDALIMELGFTEGGLSGAACLQDLQSSLKQAIPTLFISPRDDLQARLAATRAWGGAYLTEPIELANIVEKLDSLLIIKTPQPYRILIIEDSPSQAYYIENTLKGAGMITEVVSDPFTLMKVLVEFRPELILMDMYLPKCTGLELANVIRQHDAYVSVPIVFLSSEQDINRQLKALMLGGDDFLTKPIEASHLISAIASRANRSRALRTLMTRDSLTGLFNHTSLLEQFDIEVFRSYRDTLSLSFVMLDIDNFKQINDTYGHPVGDRVIKSIAHLLQQRLRKTDTIGRYGGEEFAIILPNTRAEQSFGLVNEIRTSFANILHFVEQHSFSVTFSAGIASLEDTDKPENIPENADKALYMAKKNGRNQVVAFTNEE